MRPVSWHITSISFFLHIFILSIQTGNVILRPRKCQQNRSIILAFLRPYSQEDRMAIDVSNDPEIERLGANATAIFALEFFHKLQDAARKDARLLDPLWGNDYTDDAHFTTQICLTKDIQKDIRLYRRFRSNFGTLPLSNIKPDMLSGPRWASLLLASEGIIADFNFITLLREDVNSIFWMNELEVCDGLAVVPRAQFIFVEVTRIHEKMYGCTFRRNLHIWDTKTQADALEAALLTQQEQDGINAVTLLKTMWPFPRKAVLSLTGVVKIVKKGMSVATSETLQQACRDLLQYWQDLLDLGVIQRGLSGDRHAQVVERAGKALSLSEQHGNSSASKRATLPVKTTVSLNDVILNNHSDMKSAQRIFRTFGMLLVEDFIKGDFLKKCQNQSKDALQSLITEQLEPRGLQVDGNNEFDFAEVRQRPGHRIDNRYKILDDPDSPIATLSQQLCESLPGFLSNEDGITYKVLHCGVVHSFPRESESDPIPDAQLWHRDGPSLFTTAHHDTHCFNVFIPLVDVNTMNGTTEFIPGTHDDDCFEEMVGDVIQLSQEDPLAQHKFAIRADVAAGAALVFDVRVLHRGLSNASMQERPMLYFTLAREWFVEEHMFTDTSIVDKQSDEANSILMDRLYQLVTGKEQRPAETEYGHPHYTDRFDLLWMELEDDKKRTQSLAAILAFCASNDKNQMAESLMDLLRCPSSHRQKQEILEASRLKRKSARIQEADVYLDYKPFQDEEDFASISADMSDVGALYALTAKIILQESFSLSKLGFPADMDGVLLLLALLKAYATTRMSTVTPQLLEETFTSWWHAGTGRFSLTTNNGSDKVLVVFSSLGSGIARPEWSGSLKNVISKMDVLHVLDPSFSWYCQDPQCVWNGGNYYERELTRRLEGYKAVMFLGDSMGAAASLRFSKLANKVLAFTPQVDIQRYEAITRSDFSTFSREDFQAKLVEAVETTRAEISIHYGSRCNEDVRHVGLLPTRPNVTLVEHDYDDHILSLHLRDLGKLQGIIEDAVNSFVA